jgi:hypothetical protein
LALVKGLQGNLEGQTAKSRNFQIHKKL